MVFYDVVGMWGKGVVCVGVLILYPYINHMRILSAAQDHPLATSRLHADYPFLGGSPADIDIEFFIYYIPHYVILWKLIPFPIKKYRRFEV